MARSADVLEHPVTGERLVWRRVARDTNGALLEGDMFARPGGHPAASHVHPNQQERFRVLDGKIMLKVAGEETILLPGQSAAVPPGQPHTWRNLGVEQAHILWNGRRHCAEMLFETLFGLARDGKTNRRGLPNLLRLAVMLQEYDQEVGLARPAPGVQRVVFWPLALLGRRLGYRGWNPEYSPEPRPRAPRAV